MNEELYSVKMRANKSEEGRTQHISGAEKIVPKDRLEEICSQLLQRALCHSKGDPDFINIKIEKIKEEVPVIDALPVTTREAATSQEGIRILKSLMEQSGIIHTDEILARMKDTWGMRGGMLLHVDTLERMEPDRDRGIRVTYMDEADASWDKSQKNHFREALVLASKAARHKNIVGELCISDDPDYVTGYFASGDLGYVRITKLKEMGCPEGGRIFLFRGSRQEAQECLKYLEQEKILVRISDK